jgi:heat shock protein HtpX
MNQMKTFILLAAMTALFGGVGLLLGGQTGMVFALCFAAIMNIGSWWFSDKMVLRLYKAQEVTTGALFDMTQELAVRAGIPMPRVYIIENPQPNAFATGRNPQHGAVAATTGIMQILNERELRGVIAHELAHIKNYDTLTMTITATIAGAISMLAQFALFFGGGGRDENGNRSGNIITSLLIMFLAPLAASLVQMTISRVREYSADRDGGMICGDPLALASALQKLEKGAAHIDNHTAEENPATAHMFIINPLHQNRTRDHLFSTHPKTINRVEALEKLAKSLGTEPSSTALNPWD